MILGVASEHRQPLAIGVDIEREEESANLVLSLHLSTNSCVILDVSETLTGHQ